MKILPNNSPIRIYFIDDYPVLSIKALTQHSVIIGDMNRTTQDKEYDSFLKFTIDKENYNIAFNREDCIEI